MAPCVVAKVIGRCPAGREGLVAGYHRFTVSNVVYPGLYPQDGGTVSGIVYEVNDEELKLLDEFEGDEYSRETVEVQTNIPTGSVKAYVYVWCASRDRLSGTWNYETDFLPHAENFVG